MCVITSGIYVYICQNRFHQPAGKSKKVVEAEQKPQKPFVKKGPKATDWRSGPAQFWYGMYYIYDMIHMYGMNISYSKLLKRYDMLELPEECPGYDYGLKVASKEEQIELDTPGIDAAGNGHLGLTY